MIAFLVVMLIVGLSRPTADTPPTNPTSPIALVLQSPEQVEIAQGPEGTQSELEAQQVDAPQVPAEPSPPYEDERETPEPAGPAPEGCTTPGCQSEFARYAIAPAGKAFAIDATGQGFWAAGENSVSDAIRRALGLCAEVTGADLCRVALVAGR